MADEDRNAFAVQAASVVSAAAGATAGIGGHALVAVLGAAGAQALQPILVRGVEWIGEVFRLSASRCNRTVEQLVSELDRTPEQQELLIKTMEASRAASLESKRGALAASLARGIESAVTALQETEFVRVLDGIDIIHISILAVLAEPRDSRQLAPSSPLIGPLSYVEDDITDILHLDGRPDRFLAVLAAHGLAENRRDYGDFGPVGGTWSITHYGLVVLKRLREGELSSQDGHSS